MTTIPRNALPNLTRPQYWIASGGGGGGNPPVGGAAGKLGPGGRFKAVKTGYNRYERQNSG